MEDMKHDCVGCVCICDRPSQSASEHGAKPFITYPSEAVQTALEADLKYLLLPNHRTRVRRSRLPRNKQHLNHEHRDAAVCEVFPTEEKAECLDSSRCIWLCEGEEALDKRGRDVGGKEGACLATCQR